MFACLTLWVWAAWLTRGLLSLPVAPLASVDVGQNCDKFINRNSEGLSVTQQHTWSILQDCGPGLMSYIAMLFMWGTEGTTGEIKGVNEFHNLCTDKGLWVDVGGTTERYCYTVPSKIEVRHENGELKSLLTFVKDQKLLKRRVPGSQTPGEFSVEISSIAEDAKSCADYASQNPQDVKLREAETKLRAYVKLRMGNHGFRFKNFKIIAKDHLKFLVAKGKGKNIPVVLAVREKVKKNLQKYYLLYYTPEAVGIQMKTLKLAVSNSEAQQLGVSEPVAGPSTSGTRKGTGSWFRNRIKSRRSLPPKRISSLETVVETTEESEHPEEGPSKGLSSWWRRKLKSIKNVFTKKKERETDPTSWTYLPDTTKGPRPKRHDSEASTESISVRSPEPQSVVPLPSSSWNPQMRSDEAQISSSPRTNRGSSFDEELWSMDSPSVIEDFPSTSSKKTRRGYGVTEMLERTDYSLNAIPNQGVASIYQLSPSPLSTSDDSGIVWEPESSDTENAPGSSARSPSTPRIVAVLRKPSTSSAGSSVEERSHTGSRNHFQTESTTPSPIEKRNQDFSGDRRLSVETRSRSERNSGTVERGSVERGHVRSLVGKFENLETLQRKLAADDPDVERYPLFSRESANTPLRNESKAQLSTGVKWKEATPKISSRKYVR